MKTRRRLMAIWMSVVLLCFLVPQGALTATSGEEASLFQDDFSTERSEWIVSGGSWALQDGRLSADGMPTEEAPQPEPKYRWVDGLGTDVIATADVTPTDVSNPDHRIGLTAHVKGGAGDQKWNLIFHNGHLSLLEEGIAWRNEVPFAYAPDQTYHFKMSVVNGRVNGKAWPAGTAEPADWMVSDSFAGQPEEDGVGLYAGNGKAVFDNFTVLAAPSFKITGTEPGHVFTSGQPAGFHVELGVKTPSVQTFDITAVIKDQSGSAVWQTEQQASASAGQPYQAALTVPELPKGYYTAEFKLFQAGHGIQSVNTSLVVAAPKPSVSAAQSPFGIGSRGAFLGDRFDQTEAAVRYAMLEKLGVKWLREELFWDSLRPDPNQPYLWERFDGSVELARSHGLSIMGIIDYFSSWSMPYGEGKNTEMDQAIANFAQYAGDVVRYYKPNGTLAQQKGWDDGYGITAWEIWNEPPTFWFGTAEEFGRLVKAASAAIREADANATVIVTNAGEDFDQTVFDIAGAASYDELAIHLYPGPMGPEKGAFAPQVRQTRQFLDRNTLTDTGIWVTEFGWDTFQVSEQEQAAYLVRANVELLAAGAERNFAFTFNYGSEPPGWSVVHPDQSPKPAFAAYAEMAHQLSGLPWVRTLPMGSAVRGHVFSDGTNHASVVWSAEESGTLRLSGTGIQAFDMMGRPVGQTDTEGFTVPLTRDPVYLVARQGTLDELSHAVSGAKISGIAPLGIAIDQLAELPTQLPPLKVTVSNRTNEMQRGTVKLTLPEGWDVAGDDLPFGPLAPGEEQRLEFTITQVVTNEDNRYPIHARATAADGTPVTGQTVLSVLGSVHGTPVIDGDLGDWTGALGVSVDKPEQIVGIPNWTTADLSAKLYTMWDEENLYFAAVVTDDNHVQNNTDFWIWASDSIQLYFDTLNDKANYPAADDQDLGLAHNPAAGPQVFRWTGGPYQGVVPSVNFKAQVNAQGQLVYEAAIPLSELGTEVEAGKEFGFNALINDDDGPGREGWAWWSPGIGNAWDPSQWDTWTAIRSMEAASILLDARNRGDQTLGFTANLSSPGLKVIVANEGLEKIQLNINGQTVHLTGGKDKTKNDRFAVLLEGETQIDLSEYAVAGVNTIEVSAAGHKDGQALLRFLP